MGTPSLTLVVCVLCAVLVMEVLAHEGSRIVMMTTWSQTLSVFGTLAGWGWGALVWQHRSKHRTVVVLGK